MVKPHFVVADPEVCASLGVPFVVMLADIGFWVQHYDALKIWCDQYNCKPQGMTVEIPDSQTLTTFALRWA